MTVRASKFTPGVLLSAPRRSPGIPNANGSKVLYSVSEYSFAKHSKKQELRVLDAKSNESTFITDENVSGFGWIGDEIIVLIAGDDDVTTVKIGRPDGSSNVLSNSVVGTIAGPVGDLKIVKTGDNEYGFAVSGKATPDGELYNPSKAKKPRTSGRLYTSMFVRHWDHYVTDERNSIWVASLTKGKNGKFTMSKLRNALKDSGLESPIDPFPGTEHFDISRSGLVFTAKDPDLNPALHTKTDIYYIVSEDFWNAEKAFNNSAKRIDVDGFDGAKTSPVFAPNDKTIAFLAMRQDGYEADKNQVFRIRDISNPEAIDYFYGTEDGAGSWDRSPSQITFSNDSRTLYALAEDHGRGCVYAIKEDDVKAGTLPAKAVQGGMVAAIRPLENDDLFLTSTSFIDSSLYSVFDHSTPHNQYPLLTPDGTTAPEKTTKLISSLSRHGAMFGLSRKQVDEVHWPGAAEGTMIHAWIIKPKDFQENCKYPVAFLIHGGPQGAWEDAWSTRWNPAIFAEQGYVVVCPNPTGSTGYGQAFTDAIQGQWGGLPFQDLEKGVEWLDKNLYYTDFFRAVALGASYGGYMVNWIQGHVLGRLFKALVTHDGVFSMTGQLASEELYFPFHDLKGPLWNNRSEWAQWDPSQYTEKWKTPHLIIHSELDYRLTISEGLAAFHTLQARGVESQFLTFPDENHWVLKPENSLLWHETVLDWINSHVNLPKYTDTKEYIEPEKSN